MKRMTTTKQLQNAITNNLFTVQKVEIYNKTTRETEPVNNEKFIDCLKNISKYEILADALGWTYEKDFRIGDYIVETGRMDGSTENIITVYLHLNSSTNVDDVEKLLKMEEE